MHKLVLILLISVFGNLPMFAVSYEHDNSNFVKISTADKTLTRDLGRLENLFFDSKYTKDSDSVRLERLEYRVFGSVQSGSATERVSKLKKASNAYKAMKYTQMGEAYSPYYEQSIFRSGNGWRGLFNNFGNFGNYYSGYPTGITPPIYYGNGFRNNSYYTSPDLYNGGMSKGYRTNTGWGNRYTTTGTRSGITILD